MPATRARKQIEKKRRAAGLEGIALLLYLLHRPRERDFFLTRGEQWVSNALLYFYNSCAGQVTAKINRHVIAQERAKQRSLTAVLPSKTSCAGQSLQNSCSLHRSNPGFSPISCSPRRPHVRFTHDRRAKKRARASMHQLEAASADPLGRQYNGHGLPVSGRPGGRASARRQVPITSDTVSSYHGWGRSVPFDTARAQTLPPFHHGEVGTP